MGKLIALIDKYWTGTPDGNPFGVIVQVVVVQPKRHKARRYKCKQVVYTSEDCARPVPTSARYDRWPDGKHHHDEGGRCLVASGVSADCCEGRDESSYGSNGIDARAQVIENTRNDRLAGGQ
jgi:hypothetical protein